MNAATAPRSDRAWQVLHTVPDPEIPTVTVCDLGMVREVIDHGTELEVVMTPTYSGCPATELICADVRDAIHAAGLGPARVTLRQAPAWSTDWITPLGRARLQASGIAAPGACRSHAASLGANTSVLHFVDRRHAPSADPGPACPRCGSSHTEQLSRFGATACKALHRCLDCREPFEYFKPY